MNNETTDTVRRFIADYDRGAWTALETIARILDWMKPEDAPEVVGQLPPAIDRQMQEYLKNMPYTDDEWASREFVWICGEGEPPPDWSKEATRGKVEALRRFYEEVNEIRTTTE